jgi:hypothetical protein
VSEGVVQSRLRHYITLQLTKLGKIIATYTFFTNLESSHAEGVKPNSVAVGTAREGCSPSRICLLGTIGYQKPYNPVCAGV